MRFPKHCGIITAEGSEFNGKIADENWSDEIVEIPKSFLKDLPEDDFIMSTESGNSMYPLYLYGNKVVIKKQSTLNRSGEVGAIVCEIDCVSLKKIEFIKGENIMKKFFVSLMALILGTTGYAVVDQTIETRVETLESQVSKLQEDVSVLEGKLENFDDSSKEEEKPKHELIGTEIEIPIDTYTYKRYGYISSEFDADAERVENELIIHSLKATVIDVDEYKRPDVIENIEDLTPYETEYKIKIECNFTTNIKGDYYYYIEEYYDDYAEDSEKYTYFNHSKKNAFLLDFYVNDTFKRFEWKVPSIIFDEDTHQRRPNVKMELAGNYSGTFTETIIATSLNPIEKVKVIGFHDDADSEIPMIHTIN